MPLWLAGASRARAADITASPAPGAGATDRDAGNPPGAKSARGTRSRHSRRRGPRSLQHPAFLRVWLVGTIAYLGRFVDYTAIAWLLVQETSSPFAVGALIFFRFSSFLFAGPFVGLVADRFPRIRIIRGAQAGTGAASLVLALLLFTDNVNLVAIYAYTFINGLLFLFELPARRTYMSGIVGPTNLTVAMALDMLSLNAAWFLGSNFGGVALDLVPPGYIYAGLAAVGFANFVLLRGLPILFRTRPDAERESMLQSFAVGLAFARRQRLVMGTLLLVGLTNLTGFTFEAMTVVVAREVFLAGPLLFGLLMSAQGLGSLVAAGLITVRGKRFRRPGLMVLGASAVMHCLTIVFSLVTWAPGAFVALLALGVVSMGFGIMHNTLLLTTTPNAIRGRVLGLQMLMMGLFPISSLAVGALAVAMGPGMAMRLIALVGIVMLAGVALLFPELRQAVHPVRNGSPASGPAPLVPAGGVRQSGVATGTAPGQP